MMTVAAMDAVYMPPPTASPIAATDQRLAAVVRPRTISPRNKIEPAPRKPIPDTTCAAIRDGSRTTWSRLRTSKKPNADTIMINVEPTQTSMCVRRPAAHDSRSRSKPITLPSAAARTSREMSSTLLNMSGFAPYRCCGVE